MKRKKTLPQNAWRFCALFVILFLLASGGAETVKAQTLESGSSGEIVKEVQTRLKQWGYYSGTVDGKYGQASVDAVENFQKRNSLPVTGKVDEQTAAKMGVSLGNSSVTLNKTSSNGGKSFDNDVQLLARCIYAEGRDEPYKGQVAIGAVVLNRVKNASFPNTISGVIYQPNAFSAVKDGEIGLTPNDTALKAARDALNGWDPTGGALFYYNAKKESNEYLLSRSETVTIGTYRFCL